MELFLNADLFQKLCGEYSCERLMKTIHDLRTQENPRGYGAFDRSTAWCEERLRQAGFSDVRRITHKADGETASFDFIMPQAWDLVGRSTLDMVAPVKKRIADTDITTIFVSEYAAPTPAGGVTAELVDYSLLDPAKPDCEGKFVFYRGYLPPQNPLYNSLAKAGCAGIVCAAFAAGAHAPDSPSWTNGHGHIGWYHLKEDPVVPVFCVTPKTGVELAKELARGQVVLHGEMNTRLYDGEIYTVTATIPGRSSEEFALLGHLYEPFHSDDCQGFAVGLEIGLMLKALIDRGALPQPEKTLRLVFSMERYGFAAFFAGHSQKILAAMSLDSLTCQGTSVLKKAMNVMESPLSLPFFGDMLLSRALSDFCGQLHWRFLPGNLSDDCWAAEPTLGIPTNWCVGGSSDGTHDYHHCDAPIFDAVEPEKLEKLVPMLGAYTGTLLCGDRQHFEAMAAELEKTAAQWLEIQKNRIAATAAAGRITRREALWRRQAAEMLYLGRMDSFNRFYPEVVTPVLPAHWADDFYDTIPDRALTAAEKAADSIRYRIVAPGVPFSQARVPAAERTSFPDIPELIWALLSPERSVLEGIRLRDAAHSATTSDEQILYYLAYFRFLEKYGYLERVEAKEKNEHEV